MSTTGHNQEGPCDIAQGDAVIQLVLTPKDKDLGGFSVRRVIPVKGMRSVGPWVFFDHMGPAHFGIDEGINVRPHPHIGLATVTYLFEGEMLHRDSLGNEAVIVPGDINLMVAGKGIVHSERQREEIRSRPHDMNGLQLWLALPDEAEHTDPAFYHYDSEALPQTNLNGVPVRLMIGSAYGMTSPVKTFSDTLYMESRLQAGQSLTLPDAKERGLYVVEGELRLNETTICERTMAILNDVSEVTVHATRETQIALVGGTSVGKRYMEWNFVASRPELIEQAKADWQAGRFAKVPGDEEEFIPYP